MIASIVNLAGAEHDCRRNGVQLGNARIRDNSDTAHLYDAGEVAISLRQSGPAGQLNHAGGEEDGPVLQREKEYNYSQVSMSRAIEGCVWGRSGIDHLVPRTGL